MGRIGKYRIGKEIGQGGFGRVYEAEHLVLGSKGMACLKQNINATQYDADLLVYEAGLLWNLDNHHSIPSVKDLFRIDDVTSVIALDFISGMTLEDIVKDRGKLNPEDVSWITERLLDTLRFLHHYGIIHTDIKPQNIFIEPKKSDIKLIDFGLATYKPKSGTRPRGYTPAYAAPELINGNPPIPETDLYGTGIVMLRALGGDVAKRSLPDDVPEELANFCNSFLRYDPKERPNWESHNPIGELSDIREKVFGRRHRH
jgi:eukaryotic-like serine/threonine-protein kinase